MDFEPKYVNGMLCETCHEFYEARYEAIREAAERVHAMREPELTERYSITLDDFIGTSAHP